MRPLWESARSILELLICFSIWRKRPLSKLCARARAREPANLHFEAPEWTLTDPHRDPLRHVTRESSARQTSAECSVNAHLGLPKKLLLEFVIIGCMVAIVF